ncbi:hypothetical protein QCN27_13255 [Cereibacter sp. SYSU M97828]|nr:hypothetical protein [Cereibacter flavus]
MTTSHIPELFAGAASLTRYMRQIIEKTDRNSVNDMRAALDAIHEHLAVVGGSVALLADAMGCSEEMQRLMKESADRMLVLAANGGLEGRA